MSFPALEVFKSRLASWMVRILEERLRDQTMVGHAQRTAQRLNFNLPTAITKMLTNMLKMLMMKMLGLL